MRRQIWALYTSILAAILSVAALSAIKLWWAASLAILAVVMWKLAQAWQRQNPIPMPYSMRWVLLLPRIHSRRSLKNILEPQPGERILEIGPGIGIHALTIGASLLPDGVLDVLDIQQKMLDELRHRAEKQGITNIVTTQGDAQRLPFPDRTFDAVYMVTALGEISDGAAALREMRRVLQPKGRLLIAEAMPDPDYIPRLALEQKVKRAGFALERMSGSKFSYFALFRPIVT